MSICMICKTNCSKVKSAIFDGQGELLGYASTNCMKKYRIDNDGRTGYEADRVLDQSCGKEKT